MVFEILQKARLSAELLESHSDFVLSWLQRELAYTGDQ
jgi:hypothetical protein